MIDDIVAFHQWAFGVVLKVRCFIDNVKLARIQNHFESYVALAWYDVATHYHSLENRHRQSMLNAIHFATAEYLTPISIVVGKPPYNEEHYLSAHHFACELPGAVTRTAGSFGPVYFRNARELIDDAIDNDKLLNIFAVAHEALIRLTIERIRTVKYLLQVEHGLVPMIPPIPKPESTANGWLTGELGLIISPDEKRVKRDGHDEVVELANHLFQIFRIYFEAGVVGVTAEHRRRISAGKAVSYLRAKRSEINREVKRLGVCLKPDKIIDATEKTQK